MHSLRFWTVLSLRHQIGLYPFHGRLRWIDDDTVLLSNGPFHETTNCYCGASKCWESTLYNALTKADIPAENYPFCTIEPNSGIVSLPDKRLDKLKSIYKPLKTIPSIVEFTDIAGLVKGASKGEGLGNKFLGHIRETNAIIHIVRCFENERITHVNNKIDPIQDVKVIEKI